MWLLEGLALHSFRASALAGAGFGVVQQKRSKEGLSSLLPCLPSAPRLLQQTMLMGSTEGDLTASVFTEPLV